MTDKPAACRDREEREQCAACRGEAAFAYWCTTCGRPVAQKRCPYCGLKAMKKKVGGNE